MLVAIALSVLASTAGLSITLSAPETNVLVGEPVKIVARWRTSQAVPDLRVEDDQFTRRSITFFVDDGRGEKGYREMYRKPRGDVVEWYGTTPAGTDTTVTYILTRGWRVPMAFNDARDVVFPAPGRYSLRVGYLNRGGPEVLAYSNSIVFNVVAPTGNDAVLFGLMQRELDLRDGVTVPHSRLRDVIRAHEGSPYTRWLKIALYDSYAGALQNNRDPETRESWWRLGKVESAARRRAAAERIAHEIAQDGNWGPFEEERLWLLALWARSAHDMALSSWAREQVKDLFPHSVSAAKVKEWEDAVKEAKAFDAETDDTPAPADDVVPPVLLVHASPSSLWPPNHKLTKIKVDVEASDNNDPKPVVRLLGITCDDSCDATSDIAGAEYQTDDREFQLRSERQGTSNGRTYTITYSATDRAGNRTVATTKVVIPHDQGKGKGGK
ncbi:MAG: DUF5011 domain-containing protein [Vicinamibacteria bacterium]|jgi:hypothetical protein|nr:DUF5011 domain-containing protein [Vicinamibacteria bacterium]